MAKTFVALVSVDSLRSAVDVKQELLIWHFWFSLRTAQFNGFYIFEEN